METPESSATERAKGGRWRVVATLATAVFAVTLAAAGPAVGDDRVGPPTTRSVPRAELEGFAQIAVQIFPELEQADGECIGAAALPSLSLAVVATLLTDSDGPSKTTPEQRDTLAAAINECVDRATAVQIISRHIAQLGDRAAGALGGSESSATYRELQCIEDVLGEFEPGEAFFAMYQAPIEFQAVLGDAAAECIVDDDELTWMLSRWSMARGNAIGSMPGDQYLFFSDDPVVVCLAAVAEEFQPKQVRDLVQEVFLVASPEDLGGSIDGLTDWFRACGAPVPRRAQQ